MTVRQPYTVPINVPTVGTRRPSYVVLHTTEGFGTAEDVAHMWRTNGENLGATFVIEPTGRNGFDGNLYAETQHVALHNSQCIGIEQIGFASLPEADWLRAKPHDAQHPARLRQIYMAAWTVAWVCDTFHIPVIAAGSDKTGRRFTHSAGVTQHKWVPDNDHVDCGSGYPFAKVLALAERWVKTGQPSLTTRVYIKHGIGGPGT